VRQDRIFLLHADRIAVLLEDVLQTRNRRVVLHEADSRGERDDDGDVEREVALARLLARRERTRSTRQSLDEEEGDELLTSSACGRAA
jgi:hypothetical protein